METFAEQNRVTVLNWVSFDPIFTKAVVQGKTVIELDAGVEHFGRGVDEAIDRVLLVVEPSFESLTVAKRIRSLCEGMNKKVWAVLNKTGSEAIASRLREELKTALIEVIGVIPNDPVVFEACLEGRALTGGEAVVAAGRILDALLSESQG